MYRLQQNWKVKRQRVAASSSGNEGFTIDLFDNLLYDPASVYRPSSLSMVRVDHDPAGMLAINLPPNSCRSLQFGFFGINPSDSTETSNFKVCSSDQHHSRESEKDAGSDDESIIKEMHLLLRQVHQTIFDEQVISFFFIFIFLHPSVCVCVFICPFMSLSISCLFHVLLHS